MKSKTFKIPNSDSFKGKESIGAPKKKIVGSILYAPPKRVPISEGRAAQMEALKAKYSCLRDGYDEITNITNPNLDIPSGYLKQSHLVPELFIKPYWGYEEIYFGTRLIDMAEMEAIVAAKEAEIAAAQEEYNNLDHVANFEDFEAIPDLD